MSFEWLEGGVGGAYGPFYCHVVWHLLLKLIVICDMPWVNYSKIFFKIHWASLEVFSNPEHILQSKSLLVAKK